MLKEHFRTMSDQHQKTLVHYIAQYSELKNFVTCYDYKNRKDQDIIDAELETQWTEVLKSAVPGIKRIKFISI